MVKLCITMLATGVTTADSVATIIIPQTAQLVAVSWMGYGTGVGAVGSGMLYQISSSSASQWVNDGREVIDIFSTGSDKAAAFNFQNQKVTPIAGIKVFAGDRVYLHRLILPFGVAPATCTAFLNLVLV